MNRSCQYLVYIHCIFRAERDARSGIFEIRSCFLDMEAGLLDVLARPLLPGLTFLNSLVLQISTAQEM